VELLLSFRGKYIQFPSNKLKIINSILEPNLMTSVMFFWFESHLSVSSMSTRSQRHKIVPFTTVLLLPWLILMEIFWQPKITLNHQKIALYCILTARCKHLKGSVFNYTSLSLRSSSFTSQRSLFFWPQISQIWGRDWMLLKFPVKSFRSNQPNQCC